MLTTLSITPPDYISLKVEKKTRIEAISADLLVTVSGQSLISEASAIKKAKEVAELVAGLKEIGIAEDRIHLEEVRVESQSGTFTKSSAAQYHLRLEAVPVGKIADAVGVISNSKNTKLTQLIWRFADDKELRDEVRQQCMEMALERAKRIASTLGVKLLGVMEFHENWRDSRDTPVYRGARPDTVSEEVLGMAVSHAEQAKMELHLKFRVSGFDSE